MAVADELNTSLRQIRVLLARYEKGELSRETLNKVCQPKVYWGLENTFGDMRRLFSKMDTHFALRVRFHPEYLLELCERGLRMTVGHYDKRVSLAWLATEPESVILARHGDGVV